MEPILDTDLNHRFAESLEACAALAAAEAANTCGAVARIVSCEIYSDELVVVGELPSDAIEGSLAVSSGRPWVRARSVGTFYSTWGSVLQPNLHQSLGYMVLRHPITISAGQIDDECGVARITLRVPRRFHSLRSGTLGARCCTECNSILNESRLKLLPGVRICSQCQQKKEEKLWNRP